MLLCLLVCLFVWCLTTHQQPQSDGIKLNMILMEKVAICNKLNKRNDDDEFV